MAKIPNTTRRGARYTYRQRLSLPDGSTVLLRLPLATADPATARAPIHLRDDDLLITKDGTIGKIALVKDCPEQAVLNSGVFLLRCSDGSFRHRFLYHLLTSSHFDDFLRQNLAGSTINHLYQYIFEKFSFLVPDDAHQDKICRVLDLLDIQIEATETLIAKQERVRAGLMQDLFTRGVDEHGQLRPPRHEAPYLYHQTELGWLPVGWEVGLVADVTESIIDGPFGSNLKSEHYVDEPGVRVIRLQNVQVGHYDNRDSVYVSEVHARFLSKFAVLPGDILIASLGDAHLTEHLYAISKEFSRRNGGYPRVGATNYFGLGSCLPDQFPTK